MQYNKKTFSFLKILLTGLIIFLLVLSAGCRSSENIAAARIASTDKSKLVVGCDPTYPVFEFIKDGNIVGFDIDIAREIAARMERELEVVAIDWKATYEIPEDLKLDMVISAVPITPEKKDIIDFSIPYFTMEYMLIVLNETDIKTQQNLKGESVGILNIEKSYLDEDYLLNYRIEGYDDITVMIDSLKNKNIDGILISLPMGVNFITGNTGIYRVIENVKSSKEYGIVFSKGSALKEEVNDILEEIKEDGTYDEIYARWFDYSS